MNTGIEKTYQESLEYLYSFVDYSLVRNWKFSPEQFDLTRMHQLAAALGDPHKQYPLIHVAGTKGKGSTAAFCASALRAAGYRTGLYTSPHLDDFAERIQVDGQPISHEAFVALIEEMRPYIAAIPRLTTFEIATALAFLYFARQGVNAAVIEVGLGGRLDATNIVTPVVSVITSISYDHVQILGSTLAAIAGEKAGIIKPGIPVVIAPQVLEARQVLEEAAMQQGAPLTEVGRDVKYAPLEHSLDGQAVRILPVDRDPFDLHISLLGAHQVDNAVTAYTALQVARSQGFDKISEAAIADGFACVEWPGRFEVLQKDPPLVLDCAHNRDSAQRLRQALDDYFPGWPVELIFGASEDKDIEGMLSELSPRLSEVIVVKSFHPRAANPDNIIQHMQNLGCPARAVPDVADALGVALEAAASARPPRLLLVTGSIFVAAGARIAWLKHKEIP
jgi:dihydrofolate synthase/folylpolyglutamate synthase